MIDQRDYETMRAGVTEFLRVNLGSFKDDAKGYGLFNPCQCADHNGEPEGMQLTIGTNGDSWGWQTGDNSFTGGAYSYPHWGVVYIFEDTTADDLAKEALDQIDDLLGQCGELDEQHATDPINVTGHPMLRERRGSAL
jgi:hypothetical protein